MSCLKRAEELVEGPRQGDYGHPYEGHGRTARLWSAYLGRTITRRQVAILNVLQKISRDANRPKQDNLDDICGWTRTAEICQEHAEERGLLEDSGFGPSEGPTNGPVQSLPGVSNDFGTLRCVHCMERVDLEVAPKAHDRQGVKYE